MISPFEPTAGVMLFDRKLLHAGVDVHFYTVFVDAIAVKGVLSLQVICRRFVDSSPCCVSKTLH